MTYFSQQRAHMQSHSHHAKRFLSAKMEVAEKSSLQRPPKSRKAAELTECLQNPNLDENGVKPSHSCYNDGHEDDGSLEKAHNVSVYGNPLWTEEQNPYHIKERSLAAVELDDRHDANLVVNRHTPEVLEKEDAYRSVSVLPQSDYLMYSSDSSDGEDLRQDDIRDTSFWRPQFHDVNSRSASQNSSNFEFNPSLESKDFYEQQIPMQDNMKTNNVSHARKLLYSDKANFNSFEFTEESRAPREETGRDFVKYKILPKHEKDSLFDSDPSELTGNSQGWSKNVPETFIKENNDPKEGRPEQCNPMPKNASDPIRGCKIVCSLPHQPHYDLAASDGKNIFANIIANNRQGIFWSNESLKKDMSTLSPQEEDYLYQNSDLLASFEVQGTKPSRPC